jgi:hypothetical protein
LILATKKSVGEQVKMVTCKQKSLLMSQDDNSEEKARDAARNLRDSLDTSNITGELKASFYEHNDGVFRQGTFQLASAVFRQNKKYDSLWKQAGLPVGKLNAIV